MKPKTPGYTCLAAKLLPAIIIASSGAASAATISNGGFEADTFGTSPGYISSGANGPITGWTASDNGRAGINPTTVNSPFASNGTIPEGTQVAFIQASSGSGPVTTTLTSNNGITGLTPGTIYNLSYRVNARGTPAPTMALKIGGSTILSNQVKAVGGTNPYKYVSYNFVATAPTMSLAVDSSNPTTAPFGDSTLLLDAFTVTTATPKFSTSAWNGDASSGLNNSLTYTHAFNFGGAGNAPNTTVNGVAFTGVEGGSPTVPGSFSLNRPNAFGVDPNNVAGNSADLAKSFIFNNDNATLSLEGLTDGQTYRTSIFTVGFDDVPGRNSTLSANGERLTVDASGLGNNNGTRVDYEFTASGTTQNIDIEALNGTFHTYAFANAVIPEPSSAALLGIASLGLVLRRRRNLA